MAERYVLDLKGFAERLATERAKLLKLLAAERLMDMNPAADITEGRVSGMYLAMSFLDEYLVKETDRKE